MKRITKAVLLVFATLFVVTAAYGVKKAQDVEAAPQTDVIENGVYIGEVNVSGLTRELAMARIQEYINSLEQKKITLNAMNDNSVTISGNDVGIMWINADVVDQAVTLGKSGNIVERYKALKDLEYDNVVLPLNLAVDRDAIASLIEDKCTQFNVSAKDATLKRENGEFVIEPGQTGVVIDVDGSADRIASYLTGEWNYQDTAIDLVVATDEPRGTTEELSKVKDVLGTFTTSYSTSSSNRSGNVANGCRLINGHTLYPGESFSVYKAISPFTEENGYYMAGSYSGGLVVDSLGGGICQVSTTLYNAVLRAELQVNERHNHSMIVGYVDPSADAAISGTAKDFRFTNNLEHPIYIDGYTTSDKKITFTIYGVETRPAGRKVSFESEVLETTPPQGEACVADSSKPVGYISVQSAHTGYKAQYWKIVTVDGVEQSREVINSSVYKMVPRTAAVGTATSDPAVSQAIRAAIATQSIDFVKATLAGSPPPQTPEQQAAAAQQQQQQQQAAEAAAAQAAAQAQQEADAQAAAQAAAQQQPAQ